MVIFCKNNSIFVNAGHKVVLSIMAIDLFQSFKLEPLIGSFGSMPSYQIAEPIALEHLDWRLAFVLKPRIRLEPFGLESFGLDPLDRIS